MSVNGLPYQLGAGIYDETITFEVLGQLTDMFQSQWDCQLLSNCV